MGVVLTFTTQRGDVSFGRALPPGDATAELEQVVPLDDGVLPYVWVRGTEREYEHFEDALRADGASAVTSVEEVDGRRLYRVVWDQQPPGVTRVLSALDEHVALLTASGNDERWEFKAYFPDTDTLSAFNERCQECDIDLDVTGLYRPGTENNHRLTESQRETLVAALDSGYYDIPRETTAVELAEVLGVSDQSLSERLRRAHAALVESTLR